MSLQLGVDAFHAGQGRNGSNLPALEVQIVAPEDVSEKVSFQKLVYGGSESINCPADRPSYQACLSFRSKFDAAFVGRQGACFLTDFVFDALLLPFFHDAHEGTDSVQAARETTIGVHLHEDFLDFIDCQTGIQPFVQGRLQFLQIAVGGERRNGWPLMSIVDTKHSLMLQPAL